MSEFNILVDALPSTVMVGGRDIPIDTNFRTCIIYELMMQDRDLDKIEKTISALNLFYEDCFDYVTSSAESVEEAVEQIIWFYTCGKPPKKPQPGEPPPPPSIKTRRREHDFEVDAPLIYAAFLAQYRVDLQETDYLHWWQFHAMFQGLAEDHQIVKIMGYRTLDLSHIKNKEEKRRLSRLQNKYALPFVGDVEDMERAAGALFGGMMRR